MEDSKIGLDLIAHLNQHNPPPSSSKTPPFPLPSEPQEIQPLSPVPIKLRLDRILASSSLESQVFAETQDFINTPEDIPHMRSRHHTIESIPSSIEMDAPSTTATSPPPPLGAEEAPDKLDGNTNVVPSSSEQQKPIGAGITSTSNNSTGLNKPKAEHMEYFLSTLQPEGSTLGVGQSEPRQLSPGRVPAAVHALEEAYKRNSQGSDKGSIRKSQENRRLDVTSNPAVAERPVEPTNPPQGEPTQLEAVSPIAPVTAPGTAAPTAAPPVTTDKIAGVPGDQKENGSRKKSSIRSLFNKMRFRSGSNGVDQTPEVRIARQESGSTVMTSSTPLSALTDEQYSSPQVAPLIDGVDKRNDATFYRDLKADFETRKLQGKHEHPVEGSMARDHPSGIKSMGVKQLFRSISAAIHSGSHSFKKLIVRRAKTIPDQLSATVLGHPKPEPVISKKVLTRAQRIQEYEAIIRGPLPSFGARVPTPPPIIPPPKPPGSDVLRLSAGGPFSKLGTITSTPYKTPNYRQIGLFASQPYGFAGKLSGRGGPAGHLINGDAPPIGFENGESYYCNPRFSESSSSQSFEAFIGNGHKLVFSPKPITKQTSFGQSSSGSKKRGGFF
ncbi:hypothetical protein TWF718_008745 [Orbilia javanica]|uniref:Uncharacterized protein n=1 Tax=Orbilia javanica TaxID=47235 RepID=A0AAN8MYG8_9PEZI